MSRAAWDVYDEVVGLASRHGFPLLSIDGQQLGPGVVGYGAADDAMYYALEGDLRATRPAARASRRLARHRSAGIVRGVRKARPPVAFFDDAIAGLVDVRNAISDQRDAEPGRRTIITISRNGKRAYRTDHDLERRARFLIATSPSGLSSMAYAIRSGTLDLVRRRVNAYLAGKPWPR